ncbi:MAG: ImmA/IrrE family metallo-endopeptidase [Oscillospiraceae bacterium]|nr:ImmA/IrrE family metallo-endopeptidase [Oscillospiraceae bacterium]
MIDESRRRDVYNAAFIFMIANDLATIPICPEELCRKQGIEIVSLTQIISHTGLTQDDIFSIWGNKDGVLQRFNGSYKIAYNDTMPLVRIRFTLLEELSHRLLNHCSNQDFNMFNQKYDQHTYGVYEEEARMCAGLILCPPQFYYNSPSELTLNSFQQVYKVSETCARARIDILRKYESEIKKCEFYDLLPKINYVNQAKVSSCDFAIYQGGEYAVI